MSTEYIERGVLLEGLKFPTREEIEKRYIEIEADQQPLDVLVDTMLAISRVYLEKVEGAPAADVEPVVRCKDCKNGVVICAGGAFCKIEKTVHRADFYCADGAHMDERSDEK